MARRLHRGLKRVRSTLESLYAPVQEFIDQHPDIGTKINLNFGVSIVDTGFETSFSDFISLTRTGAFQGSTRSKATIADLLSSHDFNDEDSAVGFVEEAIRLLKGGNGKKGTRQAHVFDQLKKGKSRKAYIHSCTHSTI